MQFEFLMSNQALSKLQIAVCQRKALSSRKEDWKLRFLPSYPVTTGESWKTGSYLSYLYSLLLQLAQIKFRLTLKFSVNGKRKMIPCLP